MQGYNMQPAADAVSAAQMALSSPPDAVICDLWMPSISGVQLCRLLRAEAVTMHVPVILRAAGDAPRNRFWAERAGAAAYVAKGRMGELVRSLSNTIAASKPDEEFFVQVNPESIDIRERVSELLDNALFDSVLAAEVRSLASCESYFRLFDLFSQFLTQVTTYRWMAIYLPSTDRLAVHTNPDDRLGDEKEAGMPWGRLSRRA